MLSKMSVNPTHSRETQNTYQFMKRVRSLLGQFLFSAGFLGLFAGTILLARWGMLTLLTEKRLSAESRGWPTTQGTVVSSRLDKYRRESPGCRPRIVYRYQVAGRTYKSHRISFQQSRSCREAEMAISNHPVNGSVEVHYRPGDPGEAVLLPATWNNDGFLVFGVVMMSLLVLAVLPLGGIGLLGLLPMHLVRKLIGRQNESNQLLSLWLFPFVLLFKLIQLPFTPVQRQDQDRRTL
jgi:hypothetical protein